MEIVRIKAKILGIDDRRHFKKDPSECSAGEQVAVLVERLPDDFQPLFIAKAP